MLEVQNLNKTFTSGVLRKRTVNAVRNVSFSIAEGKTLGIVGNSGCGKSTIARILLSLIQPDSGEIALDSERIPAENLEKRKLLARRIQIIFQHPESSLDPRRKLGYSLMEPMRIHRLFSVNDRRRRLSELMDRVDLSSELLERFPHQISGGEAQRAMIVRALTLDPKVLILDEPTSMLDVSIQAQVMNILRDLQAQLGLTYLFISHDLDVVRWMCDDLAVMTEGRFVEMGPADRILHSAQHPFARKLIDSFTISGPGDPIGLLSDSFASS